MSVRTEVTPPAAPVRLTRRAEKHLASLPRRHRRLVVERLAQPAHLWEAKKMTERKDVDLYSLRVGDYRVIHQRAAATTVVLEVALRNEAYSFVEHYQPRAEDDSFPLTETDLMSRTIPAPKPPVPPAAPVEEAPVELLLRGLRGLMKPEVDTCEKLLEDELEPIREELTELRTGLARLGEIEQAVNAGLAELRAEARGDREQLDGRLDGLSRAARKHGDALKAELIAEMARMGETWSRQAKELAEAAAVGRDVEAVRSASQQAALAEVQAGVGSLQGGLESLARQLQSSRQELSAEQSRLGEQVARAAEDRAELTARLARLETRQAEQGRRLEEMLVALAGQVAALSATVHAPPRPGVVARIKGYFARG